MKNSKNVIFPKSVFLFVSMSEEFLLEQEKMKNTKINPAIRKKTVTGVNFDVLTVFLDEHVKSLHQQCSWLHQKKSVMFRAESVFLKMMKRKSVTFRADSALFRIHQSLFDGAE